MIGLQLRLSWPRVSLTGFLIPQTGRYLTVSSVSRTHSHPFLFYKIMVFELLMKFLLSVNNGMFWLHNNKWVVCHHLNLVILESQKPTVVFFSSSSQKPDLCFLHQRNQHLHFCNFETKNLCFCITETICFGSVKPKLDFWGKRGLIEQRCLSACLAPPITAVRC